MADILYASKIKVMRRYLACSVLHSDDEQSRAFGAAHELLETIKTESRAALG